METRVKERLVGAVILVVLIVALVPEILSGPRRAQTGERSAGAEQPLRTYTIDLQDQRSPPAQPMTEQSEPVVATAMPAPARQSAPPPTEAPALRPPAAPMASRAPVEREPASESGWAVQLGSFSNAENAERLAAELRKRGYKAYVSRTQSGGQRRLRVRVGPEQERARAEQLADRLRREGRQATVVAQ